MRRHVLYLALDGGRLRLILRPEDEPLSVCPHTGVIALREFESEGAALAAAVELETLLANVSYEGCLAR